MKFKKKDIILITTTVLNRLDVFRRSYLSFIEKTDMPKNIHLMHVIVNNGSDKETTDWLNKHNKYFNSLITLENNVGIAKSTNIGWGQLYNTHKLKLDPDVQVLDSANNWLNNFVNAVKNIGDQNLYGQKTCNYGEPLQRKILKGIDIGVPKKNSSIDGACFFVPNGLFKKLGYFCEDYGYYGYEDLDYTRRTTCLGQQTYYIMKCNGRLKHWPVNIKAYGYDKRDLDSKNKKIWADNIIKYKTCEEHDDLYIKKNICLNSPLVVIVMPIYNQAHYAAQAIKSIISQKYENIKLVIVNDGSTDNLKNVVKQFKNDKVYYVEQKNKGTGNALNTGFKFANQNFNNIKYGTWVSGDNFYKPEFISTLVDFLEKNEKYVLAYTPFEELVESTGKIIHPKFSNTWSRDDMTRGCQMGICFLFNWHLKRIVGDYIPEICEDFNMHIKMAAYGDFYFLKDSKPLGTWRNHDKALSNVKLKEAMRMRDECLKFAKEIL